MRINRNITAIIVFLFVFIFIAYAQTQPAPPKASGQNPSPMTEAARTHQRVAKSEVAGKRWKLSTGNLLLPEGARVRRTMPLFVHFHGAEWLAEKSAVGRNRNAAVLSVHLGAGSGVYSKAFADPQRFQQLLQEAAKAIDPANPPVFRPVVLSSFSAGYGAIREILKNRDNWPEIEAVVLVDSLHTGYASEVIPGPIETEPLQPFLEFARAAAQGDKQMVVTHSEIFPGTFASTTETSDYLVSSLGLKRRPVLKWGPGGMQQISDVRQDGLHVLGFAGNSAPDHIDQFHGLGQWLKLVK
jgi:hypothetical protein